MRSKKVEHRIPWTIYDQMRRRCSEEDYKNLSRYVIGCVIRDVMSPQRHIFNKVVAEATPDLQDKYLAAFLASDVGGLMDVVKGCLEKVIG